MKMPVIGAGRPSRLAAAYQPPLIFCALLVIGTLLKASVILGKPALWQAAEAPLVSVSPAKGDWVGRNYYSQLALSFISGHLDLPGPYHPDLQSHPNPYGKDALYQGVIIQDASYFAGKYYLYFGPAPAGLFYVPCKLVTGRLPSDTLVMLLLVGVVALSTAFVLSQSAYELRAGPGEARDRAYTLVGCFALAFYNPLMIWLLRWQNVLAVARVSALVFLALGCILLLREFGAFRTCRSEQRQRTREGVVFFAMTLLSLAFLCKFNFVLDAIAFAAYGVFMAFRHSRVGRSRMCIVILTPLAVGLALQFSYNHARFGDWRDVGVRWQTNGLDLRVDPLIDIRPDPGYLFKAALERVEDYVLTLPVRERFNPPKLVPRGRSKPYLSNARFYSEGNFGVVWFAPLILMAPYFVLRTLASPVRYVRAFTSRGGQAAALYLCVFLWCAHTAQVAYTILAISAYATEVLVPSAILIGVCFRAASRTETKILGALARATVVLCLVTLLLM